LGLEHPFTSLLCRHSNSQSIVVDQELHNVKAATMIRLLVTASACLYPQSLPTGSVVTQLTSQAIARSRTFLWKLSMMGKFSFGFGGDRDAHFDTFSSHGSSSSSRSETRRDNRSRRDSSPCTSPLTGLNTMFDRMMHETMSNFNSHGAGFHTRDRLPERGRPIDSHCDSGDFITSAYSGFSGVSRGRRRSSSSSDSDRDTIRPSTYSQFPGMPGMAGSSYQTEGSRSTEVPREFFMRRTDSHSSSSRSRRYRSPSPPASTYASSRGYRTTEHAPQSAWAPGAPRTESSPSYHPGYPTARAPSQSRRRRSPSPVSRSYGGHRRRSPSPPTSGYGRSGRSDSARGYCTTERQPEGASAGSSSYNRSRSRAGPERPSANQYNGYSQWNGGYPGSNSQPYSTSHNAYDARPTGGSRSQSTNRNDQKHDRARSPSSQPRGHTRDQSSHSRTRSASSSSNTSSATSKPKRPRAELKEIFDAYNAKWEALSRTDKAFPLPATSRELAKLDFAGSSASPGKWSNEQILVANVQLIFLAGFGMSGSLKRGSEPGVKIDAPHLNGENMKLLGKWLSRKEQPRWHPDRMNLRTGKEGVLDEGISKKADVVAMRSAVQDLLALINK
jgi:hypothetical protein